MPQANPAVLFYVTMDPAVSGCQEPKRLVVRALVIEDETRLSSNIRTGLQRIAGFAVDVAEDGESGLHLACAENYDLIILDLMLPKIHGSDVLRKTREKQVRTPVLVLTAVDEKSSIIDLLELGADDYLSKPFDMGELIARAKALIRRSQGHSSPTLQLGGLELDLSRRTVRRDGTPIALKGMEFRVLEYLMLHMESVVSKTELLEHLYDYNWEKFSNVIEVYVSGLRRKIDGEREPKLLHTLRGQGYVLRVEK
jgi:two-component system response regulator PhoP